MHYIRLIVSAICIAVTGHAAEEQGKALEFNIAEVVEQSDVIIVGQFTAKDRFDVSAPFLKYYSVRAKDAIKGELPVDAVIVVDTGVLSAAGSSAAIEESFQYLVFLKRQNSDKSAEKFTIVGMWRGVIALDKDASEQRSVKGIRSKYDVDVFKQWDAFQSALRRLAESKSSASPLVPAAKESWKRLRRTRNCIIYGRR